VIKIYNSISILVMLVVFSGCSCSKRADKTDNNFVTCDKESILYSDLSKACNSRLYYKLNGELCNE